MARSRLAPATLFVNGKFVTLSHSRPRASALLAEDGRISSIGSNAEVKRSAPRGVEKVDLKDRYVVPAFNDCHTHFIQMGVDSMTVDLSRTHSLNEALRLMRKAASTKPKGEWVIGTSWQESAWPNGRFISKGDLDDYCPDHPAVAYRVCGHLCSVNSKAILELGMDAATPEVGLDVHGNLTGILTEGAVSICRDATEPDAKVRAKGLVLATKKAHRLGATSVTDNGSTADLATYIVAARKGTLGVRVSFNMPYATLDSLQSTSISTGLGDHWLRLGGLKVFCDGALGARSAALSKPYSDDPRNKGMFVHKRAELDDLTERANRSGLQLAVHAIGDRGIGVAIESIASALKSHPRKDHRHRIEHLELPSRAHIRAMRRLGIIASMQPNFIGEWGGTEGMYRSRLGLGRTSRNNPFREVLDERVRLVFGSDCMPFSPLYGIASAVNAPFQSQRISPLEGIVAYTRDAAFSSFEEGVKGTLEEGKVADFTVLSGDPLVRKELRSMTVLATVAAGRFVYRSGNGPGPAGS